MGMPTTAAMVAAAQDAFDVAAADEAVALAKVAREGESEESVARWVVANRQRTYALSVLASVSADYKASGAA